LAGLAIVFPVAIIGVIIANPGFLNVDSEFASSENINEYSLQQDRGEQQEQDQRQVQMQEDKRENEQNQEQDMSDMEESESAEQEPGTLVNYDYEFNQQEYTLRVDDTTNGEVEFTVQEDPETGIVEIGVGDVLLGFEPNEIKLRFSESPESYRATDMGFQLLPENYTKIEGSEELYRVRREVGDNGLRPPQYVLEKAPGYCDATGDYKCFNFNGIDTDKGMFFVSIVTDFQGNKGLSYTDYQTIFDVTDELVKTARID
jgi:hypothetical protein